MQRDSKLTKSSLIEKYQYIGLLLSSVFFLFGLFNSLDVTSYLFAGLLCGCLWSVIILISLLTPNNFNFLLLGAAAYILSCYGGFLYAWQVSGMSTIMYMFSAWNHVFSEIDILWGALYSNFFCVVFIYFGQSIPLHNILSSSLDSVKVSTNTVKSNISVWVVCISLFKIILILTGQQKVSFLIGDELPVLGDQGTAISIFASNIAPISTFFLGFLLSFPFIRHSKAERKRTYLYIVCLLIDLFFAFSIGRRPLIYHLFILLLSFTISLSLNATSEQKIKYNNNKFKIILLVLAGLFMLQILFQVITSLRFMVTENAAELNSFSFLDVVQLLVSQGFNAIIENKNQSMSHVEENLSIRNAFTMAYISHVMHGLFIFKKVAYGAILLSSMLVVIPSSMMLTNKSQNIQGEAQINDLVNGDVRDGANTLISYSVADFFILGPFVYSIVTVGILVCSFNVIKLLFKNSEESERSIFVSMWFCIVCYFFISMGEVDIADLIVSLRSLFILAALFNTVQMFSIKSIFRN